MRLWFSDAPPASRLWESSTAFFRMLHQPQGRKSRAWISDAGAGCHNGARRTLGLETNLSWARARSNKLAHLCKAPSPPLLPSWRPSVAEYASRRTCHCARQRSFQPRSGDLDLRHPAPPASKLCQSSAEKRGQARPRPDARIGQPDLINAGDRAARRAHSCRASVVFLKETRGAVPTACRVVALQRQTPSLRCRAVCADWTPAGLASHPATSE